MDFIEKGGTAMIDSKKNSYSQKIEFFKFAIETARKFSKFNKAFDKLKK